MQQTIESCSYPNRLHQAFPKTKQLTKNYEFCETTYLSLERFLFSLSTYGCLEHALADAEFGKSHLFTLLGASNDFRKLINQLTKPNLERDYRLLKQYAHRGKEVYIKKKLVSREVSPQDFNKVADMSLAIHESEQAEMPSDLQESNMQDLYKGITL